MTLREVDLKHDENPPTDKASTKNVYIDGAMQWFVFCRSDISTRHRFFRCWVFKHLSKHSHQLGFLQAKNHSASRNAKCPTNFQQNDDGRGFQISLQQADVIPRNAGIVSQFFLRQISRQSCLT